MALHVIVGAGPVGNAVASLLAEQGEQVRVITRSGTGIEAAEKVAADAGDGQRLAELATGAAAIYNCVNPQYHRWATDWPPIAAALLTAAEASGAVLAITGNLYAYGKVTAPMTEQTPIHPNGTKGEVRAKMWRDALQAHHAGRIRAFEVRGSDYLGGNSILGTVVAPAWRKGRTAYVPADLDVAHTWTSTVDVARLLVAAVADESAHGQVWHVPSAPACSARELAGIAAGQLGVPNKVRSLPYPAIWAAGFFNPFVRELRETQYQFRAPFVLDSSAAQKHFGLEPAPLEDSVRLDLANSAQS